MTALGQKLIDSVRHIVSQQPDFVYRPPRQQDSGRYSSCQYIRNGCGDCLIGRALLDVGVIGIDLEDTASNHVPIVSLADTLQLEVSIEELVWLRNVQREQDNFKPWRACIAYADNPKPLVVKEWCVA